MTTVQQMHSEFVEQQPVTVALWRPSDSDADLGEYTGRLEPITNRVFGEVQYERTLQTELLIHQECIVIPELIVDIGRGDRATVVSTELPEVVFNIIRVDRYVGRTGLIVERRD